MLRRRKQNVKKKKQIVREKNQNVITNASSSSSDSLLGGTLIKAKAKANKPKLSEISSKVLSSSKPSTKDSSVSLSSSSTGIAYIPKKDDAQKNKVKATSESSKRTSKMKKLIKGTQRISKKVSNIFRSKTKNDAQDSSLDSNEPSPNAKTNQLGPKQTVYQSANKENDSSTSTKKHLEWSSHTSDSDDDDENESISKKLSRLSQKHEEFMDAMDRISHEEHDTFIENQKLNPKKPIKLKTAVLMTQNKKTRRLYTGKRQGSSSSSSSSESEAPKKAQNLKEIVKVAVKEEKVKKILFESKGNHSSSSSSFSQRVMKPSDENAEEPKKKETMSDVKEDETKSKKQSIGKAAVAEHKLMDLIGAQDNEQLFGFDGDKTESSSPLPKKNSDLDKRDSKKEEVMQEKEIAMNSDIVFEYSRDSASSTSSMTPTTTWIKRDSQRVESKENPMERNSRPKIAAKRISKKLLAYDPDRVKFRLLDEPKKKPMAIISEDEEIKTLNPKKKRVRKKNMKIGDAYLISPYCKIYNHLALIKSGVFLQDLVIDSGNFYNHRHLWYYFEAMDKNKFQITVRYGLKFGTIDPPIIHPKILELKDLQKKLAQNYHLQTMMEFHSSHTMVTLVNLNAFVGFLKIMF